MPQDIGDGWCVRTLVTVGSFAAVASASVGGVGWVVGNVGGALGRPGVLDQDLAVGVGEGDGAGVPDRDHRGTGQVAVHQERDPADVDGAKPRVLWRLVYLVPVVAGRDCSWRWRSGAQAASCSAGVRMPMAECGRMVPVPVDPLGGGDHGRRRCPARVPGCGSARPCTAS